MNPKKTSKLQGIIGWVRRRLTLANLFSSLLVLLFAAPPNLILFFADLRPVLLELYMGAMVGIWDVLVLCLLVTNLEVTDE